MPSSVCMHCRVVDGRYMVYGQLVDGAIFAVNPVNLRGKPLRWCVAPRPLRPILRETDDENEPREACGSCFSADLTCTTRDG